MREHAQKNDDAEIDMTPMLDIVFIMLIFFIVTAVFVKEAGRDVNKPFATLAEEKAQVSILIAVTEDDEIVINRNVVELQNVRSLIETLHRENPKGTVAIQADVKASNSLVQKVSIAAYDAGVPTVSLATER